MGHARVDICLSTHRASRFLAPQVDSILRQSHDDLRLLIRDDGSDDGTPALLERLARAHPEKIELLNDGGAHLGVTASYSRLLGASNADYLMLCDQDDVWDSRKVELSLEGLRAMEETGKSEQPLLIHTDLRVVDAELRPIAASFWRYQKLDPRAAQSFSRLLVHNVVTGCASLFNRALVERALPIPAESMMHDWWLALVASAFGRVGCVPEPTVSYRQHSANLRGAEAWRLGGANRSNLRRLMGDCSRQSQTFLRRYDGQLEPRHRKALVACSQLLSYGFLRRRAAILRHGLFKVGLARNLSTLARI